MVIAAHRVDGTIQLSWLKVETPQSIARVEYEGPALGMKFLAKRCAVIIKRKKNAQDWTFQRFDLTKSEAASIDSTTFREPLDEDGIEIVDER